MIMPGDLIMPPPHDTTSEASYIMMMTALRRHSTARPLHPQARDPAAGGRALQWRGRRGRSCCATSTRMVGTVCSDRRCIGLPLLPLPAARVGQWAWSRGLWLTRRRPGGRGPGHLHYGLLEGAQLLLQRVRQVGQREAVARRAQRASACRPARERAEGVRAAARGGDWRRGIIHPWAVEG